jgi:hypothetical protein
LPLLAHLERKAESNLRLKKTEETTVVHDLSLMSRQRQMFPGGDDN